VLARGGRCGHVVPRGALHVRAASHSEGWLACARDGQELVGSDGDATTRRQGRPDRSDTAAPPPRVRSRTSNCPSAALLPAGDSISIIVHFRSQPPAGKRFRLDGITVRFLSPDQTTRCSISSGFYSMYSLLIKVLDRQNPAVSTEEEDPNLSEGKASDISVPFSSQNNGQQYI
jgi:hypothetical protein